MTYFEDEAHSWGPEDQILARIRGALTSETFTGIRDVTYSWVDSDDLAGALIVDQQGRTLGRLSQPLYFPDAEHTIMRYYTVTTGEKGGEVDLRA